MSNNSVSIRSPLSCVRGLHANRCPRLMLTSYSWLAAIKSINENINTAFSASLSPDVRAAQRQRFPRAAPCEWTRCSQPARSGSPACLLNSVCRDARGQTDRHTHHVCPLATPARPSRERWDKGRKCLLTQGLTHGLNAARLCRISLCFAEIPLCCAVTASAVIKHTGGEWHARNLTVLYTLHFCVL